MKIFGISGWSGSGKTTLVLRLIPVLTARGLRVATIKHTHHVPALGDDEARALAEAGAVETLTATGDRFALVHELKGEPEPSLAVLATKFTGIDLLLVEGFKFGDHPKLEVWDPGSGKSLRAPEDPHVVAIACDGPVPVSDRPVFPRGDIEAVAEFVCATCGL